MLILPNIYKDMGARMSQFMTKNYVYRLLFAIFLTIFDGFAYNKANSVNLSNKQTDHKSLTVHV